MSRPPVDVVIPFQGERSELAALLARLRRLALRDGDTLVVVDNTPGAPPITDERIGVVQALEYASPGYARNRGAERGNNDWIVFIDADTDPVPELLDRYFEPQPGTDTVLLAGGVRDEPVPLDATAVARYAYLRGVMSQDRTLSAPSWTFVQSSNVACRRSAFEFAGGFRESIRAAEDADLTFRLRQHGGLLERREGAAVVHRSRRSMRDFVRRAALYGAGAAWLERHYPGSRPRRRLLGLLWWSLRWSLRGCVRAVRARDRDQLLLAVFDPIWELAFELGRSGSVELECASESLSPKHG